MKRRQLLLYWITCAIYGTCCNELSFIYLPYFLLMTTLNYGLSNHTILILYTHLVVWWGKNVHSMYLLLDLQKFPWYILTFFFFLLMWTYIIIFVVIAVCAVFMTVILTEYIFFYHSCDEWEIFNIKTTSAELKVSEHFI